MSIFIDTSAILAALDADDEFHGQATSFISNIIGTQPVITSNYVLLETSSLVQRRLGVDILRSLYEDIVPLIDIEWIDQTIHDAAINAVLVAGRRKLSLVDCSSFVVMRQLGLKRVFTFDQHFAEQGFVCVP